MTARYTPMRCEEFADELGAYFERDVDESTRATMDAHALACAECGALVADLRRLRVDAGELPDLVPSRDLWEGIAARIDAPVISIAEGRMNAGEHHESAALGRARRGRLFRGMLAAASLLTAAGLGGVATYALMPHSGATAPMQVAATPTPAQTIDTTAVATSAPVQENTNVATNASFAARPPVPVAQAASRTRTPGSAAAVQVEAEATFDAEIARLRAIVKRRSTQLDPVTLGVVERNLKVIDEAIAQCKAALAKDPSSRFLIESLNGALANKVELLRTAAMLPART